ncbi:cell division protein FtsZ [Lyticum sinuosum]|uniref:Cell division protein FtsZ n=1 Tax=Lyticum sinuosum TaxID=1332059 RepID=A0AAE4VKR9_9RICK|nr:cell division protein FtsZ [Lyticum sinuosum]MDZ5761228.1 Cell division protein FtsZ [Lyticum sinuosum]
MNENNIKRDTAASSRSPKIMVAGIGGAGCNTINNMINELSSSNVYNNDIQNVDRDLIFVAMNTDFQALKHSLSEIKLSLGVGSTKGLGAGSNPEVGRTAAEESIEEISRLFDGVDMLFIAAGMGGGTGTGAAPIIAQVAKEMGILTVGVVTKPFKFEGIRRMLIAEAGLSEMERHVDTLIVIPNQNLFRTAGKDTTFEKAFKMVDGVLHTGILAIIDLIRVPGIINLDFADIESIMRRMGRAMMGTGEAEGENRAHIAAEIAISNPLLENSTIKGARGILVSISGGDDMTLFEVDEAANRIREEVDHNANIIFGSAFNPELKGKIKVSVVATGIDQLSENHESKTTNDINDDNNDNNFRETTNNDYNNKKSYINDDSYQNQQNKLNIDNKNISPSQEHSSHYRNYLDDQNENYNEKLNTKNDNLNKVSVPLFDHYTMNTSNQYKNVVSDQSEKDNMKKNSLIHRFGRIISSERNKLDEEDYDDENNKNNDLNIPTFIRKKNK